MFGTLDLFSTMCPKCFCTVPYEGREGHEKYHEWLDKVLASISQVAYRADAWNSVIG